MEKSAGFFSFTLYDLISHILPGALLLIVVYFLEQLQEKIPNEIFLFTLIVVSFITGQILFAVGNFLYYVSFYPSDYKNKRLRYSVVNFLQNVVNFMVRQKYGYKGLEIKNDLTEQIEQKLKLKNLNNQARFQLCDVIVAKEGFPEREVLLAKQGFYRSTSALVALSIPYIIFRGGFGLPLLFWLVLYLLFLRVLLYAHTYYGEIRKVQIYSLAYMKLREMK